MSNAEVLEGHARVRSATTSGVDVSLIFTTVSLMLIQCFPFRSTNAFSDPLPLLVPPPTRRAVHDRYYSVGKLPETLTAPTEFRLALGLKLLYEAPDDTSVSTESLLDTASSDLAEHTEKPRNKSLQGV